MDSTANRAEVAKGFILLVEDDANDVFFMTEAFRKARVASLVQVATDGRMAIEQLKSSSAASSLPRLVLLDLKLPYVMGLEVLRCIRQELNIFIPVIVLSSSSEPADVREAYRLGANAYLVKPSDRVRLAEMVRTIDAFWLSQNVEPH